MSENSVATTAYGAVAGATRFIIDGSEEVFLGADGTALSSKTPDPDITIRLASDDAVALMDGSLSVTRAVTAGRVAAEGPIFLSIAALRAISYLTNKGE